MRMILNGGTPEEMVFEGSMEELAQLRQHLMTDGKFEPIPSVIGEGGREFVSEEVAYRMLTRLPLSKEQRSVLRRIYDAAPGFVNATQLQEQINYSTAQFSGLMGAFGRRLTHTKGYKDPSWFFDNVWDPELQCNRYRLPESVRAAMRRANLIDFDL